MGKFHVIAGVFIAAFASSPLWAAGPNPEAGRPFPEGKIPSHARGPEIIQALGQNLPEVAHWYGASEEEFRAAVGHDHSVRSDAEGLLYYVCEIEAAETAGDSDSTQELAAGTDAFALHSRPGASLVIHLDFDGHVTSGTNWNSAYAGGSDIVTPPYDTDGDPTSFSSGERSAIAAIWARIAEDFAAWDVDVTTEDPGASALAKSSTNDGTYGIRACIGGSCYDWFGTSAGGVAYVGSYTWNQDTPCFIFEAQLGNGNVKYTAEAASHEIGHTLGLYHDGDSSTAYYAGHGNWAPIMGVGYYKEVTQWSSGEYANANNLQDDIQIITSRIPLRGDLVGDDIGTTVTLAPGSISGVIEERADADLYRIETQAGTVQFSATNFGNQPNLDMMLVLYDGAGNPLLSSDPAGLTASLSATVSAGTYFIGVEGVGTGDPTTGYSDYSSLGEFLLTASYAPSNNLSPTADASGSGPVTGRAPLTVAFSSTGSADPDGVINAYDWDFADGSVSGSANPSHTFTVPGTYLVSLIVYDDEGASGSDTVTIVVEAAQPPVAQIETSGSLSGYGPLTVVFDGSSSYDPDGSIVEYAWDFGDGAVSATSAQSHTFDTPGIYTVELTVTDDEGLSATDSVEVTVLDAANLPTLVISDLSISVSGNDRKGYAATVYVTVVDEKGRTVQNATVTGTWSGIVSGTETTTTSRKGVATFRSAKMRSSGPVAFEVTDIALSGYVFDAGSGDGPIVSAIIP